MRARERGRVRAARHHPEDRNEPPRGAGCAFDPFDEDFRWAQRRLALSVRMNSMTSAVPAVPVTVYSIQVFEGATREL